jgi:hypothetical protein
MATDQLTTTTGSQSQTTAQAGNLQPTGQAGDTATNSSDVQPGTATSLLSSQQGGVPLHGTSLSQVSLNNPTPAALPVATTTTTVVKPHHVNTVFLGFSGLLFVVAVILFWTTSRSVKSTT